MCYDYTGKSAPSQAKFREPRSTALYPNPRYNEARYNEGRLYSATLLLRPPKSDINTEVTVLPKLTIAGGFE